MSRKEIFAGQTIEETLNHLRQQYSVGLALSGSLGLFNRRFDSRWGGILRKVLSSKVRGSGGIEPGMNYPINWSLFISHWFCKSDGEFLPRPGEMPGPYSNQEKGWMDSYRKFANVLMEI